MRHALAALALLGGSIPALLAPGGARAQWRLAPEMPAVVNDAQPPGKHNYNYAPTVVAEGDRVRVWWCGRGPLAGDTDVIFHRAYDRAGRALSPARVVLRATPGTWDASYVCDPGVAKGRFPNPEDGRTYAYALYYSGVAGMDGLRNAVGLAFSDDGLAWTKLSRPAIVSQGTDPAKAGTYGSGQPSPFRAGGALLVFTTDTTTPDRPGFGDLYVRRTADGVRFDPPVRVPNVATDGRRLLANSDFAYDAAGGLVYAMAGLPGRVCTPPTACQDPAKNPDRETYRMGLFSMPLAALLDGTGRWTPRGDLDADATGHYLNHSPGLVKDADGHLDALPAVSVYFAGGDPYPGTWRLGLAVQAQDCPTLPLRRTLRAGDGQHWVTAGFTGPGFAPESVLGHVWRLPGPGTAPLYSCRAGLSHFLSRAPDCEGQIALGPTGHVSDRPRPGTRPIHRCLVPATGSHFASPDPGCEGQRAEGVLGHVLVEAAPGP